MNSIVSKTVLKQYELSDLTFDNNWDYILSPKASFTKEPNKPEEEPTPKVRFTTFTQKLSIFCKIYTTYATTKNQALSFLIHKHLLF